MNGITTSDFDEAVTSLVAFLDRQRFNSRLLWITRDDITGTRRKLYVHPSPPRGNVEIYRSYFDWGVRKGRRIRVGVKCFVPGYACAYVAILDDFSSAQPTEQGGLMYLSVAASDDFATEFPAHRCRNHVSFHCLRSLCRLRGESPLVKDEPLLRSEILATCKSQ